MERYLHREGRRFMASGRKEEEDATRQPPETERRRRLPKLFLYRGWGRISTAETNCAFGLILFFVCFHFVPMGPAINVLLIGTVLTCSNAAHPAWAGYKGSRHSSPVLPVTFSPRCNFNTLRVYYISLCSMNGIRLLSPALTHFVPESTVEE